MKLLTLLSLMIPLAGANAGQIVNKKTEATLKLVCVSLDVMDHSKCFSYQIQLATKEGVQSLSRLFDADELDLIADLPFLEARDCPFRKKDNCLVPELWASTRKQENREAEVAAMGQRYGDHKTKLNSDKVFTPFGLSAHVGDSSIKKNELMLLTIPADVVLFVPNLVIHGTQASMMSNRRKKVKAAMDAFVGKKSTTAILRNSVFNKLVQAIKNRGGLNFSE